MKTFQEILKEKGLTGHQLYIANGDPENAVTEPEGTSAYGPQGQEL